MSIFSSELLRDAEKLLQHLREKKHTLATAESCTGGLLSSLITEIPGCSDVFTHGYVTYANAAKTTMLGIPESLLKTHGAVSEPVAIAMAEGALKASAADVSVAITGVAGPGGASELKPVGLVHIASARRGKKTQHIVQQFSGDRSAVRMQAVKAAMELVQRQLAR